MSGAKQLRSGRAEKATDVADRLDERIVCDDRVAPDSTQQNVLADDLPGAFGQHQQHPQRLGATLYAPQIVHLSS